MVKFQIRQMQVTSCHAPTMQAKPHQCLQLHDVTCTVSTDAIASMYLLTCMLYKTIINHSLIHTLYHHNNTEKLKLLIFWSIYTG
jgi:hypothetical protein